MMRRMTTMLAARQNKAHQDMVPPRKLHTSVFQKAFTYDYLDFIVTAVSKSYKMLFGALSPVVTADGKRKAWEDIANRLCELSSTSRSLEKVKEKWARLSSPVKMKAAEINRLNRTLQGGMMKTFHSL
jgi:hypothetical protein